MRGRWLMGPFGLAICTAACTGATGLDLCGRGNVVDLGRDSCIDMSALSVVAPDQRATIEAEIVRTFDLVNELMPISAVRIEVIADASRTIPEVGVGGFASGASAVQFFVDPTRVDLSDIVRAHLAPQLAHELHHAKRFGTVGYGSTLVEAVVSEGLADHFSLELAGGAPPPWSSALQPEELADWTDTALAESSTAYDHSRWFFGTGSIPRWAGYSIGFALVSDFLDANPDRRPSELVTEPASLFLPD